MNHKLHHEVRIAAPPDEVRDVMLQGQTCRAWTAAFRPGPDHEGSREQGAAIRFVDGAEDTTGEAVRNGLPAFENDTLRAQPDGGPLLRVDCDMPEAHMAMMDEKGPQDLVLLRRPCQAG